MCVAIALACEGAFMGPARPELPRSARPTGRGRALRAGLVPMGISVANSACQGFLVLWLKLAVSPPFSWINWMVLQVLHAPRLYQYYLAFSLLNSLGKWLAPGLQAQLVTGTWLGLLKSFYPKGYDADVALRLRGLLEKQAALRGTAGAGAQLTPQVLEQLTEQLNQDRPLADALGSTAALRLWHRWEKFPLDDPKLLETAPEGSQGRWILQALKDRYLGDVEAASRQTALAASAQEAHLRLRALREASDLLSFQASHGVRSMDQLLKVEKASESAEEALSKLEELKATVKALEASSPQQFSSAGADEWARKLKQLQAKYAVPAIAAELKRPELM